MKHLGDGNAREEVLHRLTRVKPETPRRWGRMTAAQMVCHLNDSFAGVMGRKAVSPAVTLTGRTIMKWGALYVPMPWPRGVQTRPEMEQGNGGTPPGRFEDDCAALAAGIGQFCDPRRSVRLLPHPLFGELTERQWMRWGYLHCDHHLRQFGA
jgi:hypothetical protein